MAVLLIVAVLRRTPTLFAWIDLLAGVGVVDCVHADDYAGKSPWAEDAWLWLLARSRALPALIPYRGQLSLFNVPTALVAAPLRQSKPGDNHDTAPAKTFAAELVDAVTVRLFLTKQDGRTKPGPTGWRPSCDVKAPHQGIRSATMKRPTNSTPSTP